MIRKLYKTALITSPIIAIYGVCPFYIFKIIGLSEVLNLAIGLTINTLVTWIILIQIKTRYPSINDILLFVLSYGIIMLMRFMLIFFIPPPDLVKPPIDISYMAYPIVSNFVLNVIIIVILNSIIISYKYTQTERELQEIKLQNSEAQKLSLLQQMQPHFLFNALSNLKSLIKENADVAQDYTVKLSEFLRYSVELHQSGLVRLDKELEFTTNYIELQKVRFGHAFSYQVDIPAEVMAYQLPVLGLQTLVENIFKHNTFTDKKPIFFSIQYQNKVLIVWNRKSAKNLSQRTTTGLSNLQKRYQLVLQKSIIIQDSDDEFSVTIPLLAI